MKGLLLLIIIPIAGVAGSLDYSEKYLAAEKLFKEWKKEEAKILYQEAAKDGDINAHFALGYKYILESTSKIYHLKTAAEGGHSKALKKLIDAVFYRSDSFKHSNPSLALSVYNKAKSSNKRIKLYNEQETTKILSMCLEAKKINVDNFLQEYGAKIDESPWRWARIISSHNNNPELVLSLICLGGHVPNEKIYAIRDFYKLWKKNEYAIFNGCDYAASNYTTAICSRNERY